MIVSGIFMFIVGVSVLYNKEFMKEGLKTEVQKPVELLYSGDWVLKKGLLEALRY